MHSSGFGNGVFRYRNENILVSSDVLPKDLFVEKLKEFSDFIRKTFAIKVRCICKGKCISPSPSSRHNVRLFAAELRVFLPVTRKGRLHLIDFLSAR